MIPVFSIVGKNSNTGKTTVMCHIIKALKKKGYRIATIKHDVHGFEMDKPGKDTWKHAQAGSDIVMISSPTKYAMIQRVEEEKKLEDLISTLSNVDLVITEGYKKENYPKLEVFREEAADELLCKEVEIFALVTDKKFNIDKPQYHPNEIDELVEYIEKKFLQ
ncbi:molybdopterin-guanine dinucleotide biosynthesis protein B [Tindallia californiensis]|uniref:Molybdopterin guanine dinucleotide biosynthesis accessory protein MobB n=1 Tax=Tindallia californiensis TaxID=159292 RepID=A0A1H3QSY4_9FIRM|nr:molybdopterin-guanine dinucleotide biosynthesis protein B [Tindallia californiensis]SDZ16450.1 molybdopterin guanine dinucleotide biosynthesis accessory protein MobB [Tindallia californiensis]